MRYQSALVLSTIAVSQAVAGDVRHAHFHARRHAEEKRNVGDVDWKRVAKDVYGMDQKDWDTLVNWSTVNYGGGEPTSTSAPAAAYTPVPEATTTAAPKPATTADKSSSTSTSETKPAETSASSGGSVATDLYDLSKFAGLGVMSGAGMNAKAKGSRLWLGDDGEYKATFVNDGNQDIAIICWNAQGMWIEAHIPQIYVHLGAGEQTTVSMPYGFSGGCGAAFEDSTLMDGLLNESILEFTAKENENGCFDVSREINMNGVVMSVVGSKCTSGLKNGNLACAFVCTSGTKCGKGNGDYNIVVGAETKGPCMIGKDPYTGDPSGGCQMGNGEHVKVTVHGTRSWPS